MKVEGLRMKVEGLRMKVEGLRINKTAKNKELKRS
jgi:hypothetical protein